MDGPRPAMNGDHAIPPEIVTRHASSLRALARSLALDEHAADDVVQETWLRAFTARPPNREGLGGWLRRVAEGFALHRLRSEGRRAARERSYARERSEVVHDAGERAETLRIVVDTVLSLEEPYRETVLLRWFENLPPREIATRTGTTVATVHSRLQRAHARLRERLSTRLDRRDLGALLLPIFGWSPSHEAWVGGATAGAGGTTTVLTMLGVTMTTMKLAAAGAAALVGACALYWYAARNEDPLSAPLAALAPPVVPASLEAASTGGLTPAGSSAERAPIAAASVAAAALDAVDPYEFEVAVTPVDVNGRPRPGVDVYMGLDDQRLALLGTTDWHGVLRTRWRGSEPRITVVMQLQGSGVVPGSLRRFDLAAGVPQEIAMAVVSNDVPVLRELPVVGLYLRSDGTEWVFSSVASNPNAVFDVDEHGNGVFTEPWLAWRTDDGAGLDRRIGSRGVLAEANVALLARSRIAFAVNVVAEETEKANRGVAKIRGHVVDVTGAPRANVLVSLYTPAQGVHGEVLTDAEGAYEFTDVPPGEAQLYVGGGAVVLVDRAFTDLAADETRVVDVTCRASERTSFVFLGADGKPAAKWHVEARARDPFGTIVAHGGTDDEGRVALALPATAVRLVARREGSDTPMSLIDDAFTSRSDSPVTVPLAPSSTELTFVATRDEHVRSSRPDARLWSSQTGDGIVLSPKADEEEGTPGRVTYAVRDLAPGTWTLHFGDAGTGYRTHGPIAVDGRGAVDLGALRVDAPVTIACTSARPPESSETESDTAVGTSESPAPAPTSATPQSTPVATVGVPVEVGESEIPFSMSFSERQGDPATGGSAESRLFANTHPHLELDGSVELTTRRSGLRVSSGSIPATRGTFELRAASDAKAIRWRHDDGKGGETRSALVPLDLRTGGAVATHEP